MSWTHRPVPGPVLPPPKLTWTWILGRECAGRQALPAGGRDGAHGGSGPGQEGSTRPTQLPQRGRVQLFPKRNRKNRAAPSDAATPGPVERAPPRSPTGPVVTPSCLQASPRGNLPPDVYVWRARPQCCPGRCWPFVWNELVQETRLSRGVIRRRSLCKRTPTPTPPRCAAVAPGSRTHRACEVIENGAGEKRADSF